MSFVGSGNSNAAAVVFGSRGQRRKSGVLMGTWREKRRILLTISVVSSSGTGYFYLSFHMEFGRGKCVG